MVTAYVSVMRNETRNEEKQTVQLLPHVWYLLQVMRHATVEKLQVF